MTFRDFLLKENVKTAKKIKSAVKNKSKENNPEEDETPSGWSADPHQGTYNSLRMTR